MADLDYARVIGRFALSVADTTVDTDDDPDTVWCTEGRVVITPLNTFVKVAGVAVPFTMGGAVIEATIDSQGFLTHLGKRSINVVDLTSPKVNPRIGPDLATHRVEFINVMAGDTPVPFPRVEVRLTAAGPDGSGTNDLTLVAPVLPGEATPIYRGEQGTSVQSAEVEGGELLFTFTDGTTQSAGELPVGPGGSDAGVADYVRTPGTETAAALSATFARVFTPQAFGAIGDGVANDTQAFQDMAAAADQDGAEIYVPPGAYRIGSTITFPESFAKVRVRGAGHRQSRLILFTATSLFKVIGGSGGPSGGCISDLSIEGEGAGISGGIGVTLAGVNHFNVERVQFSHLVAGGLFFNEQAGSFTEFNVFRDCSFDSTLSLALFYAAGAGTNSFHGSGFVDCTFNQPANPTRPMIEIGSGCLVYDAPWDGTIFARSEAQALTVNKSGDIAQTYGNLRVEATSGSVGPRMLATDSARGVLHAGVLTALSQGLILENAPGQPHFRLVRRSMHHSDGSVVGNGFLIRTTRTLAAGSKPLLDLPGAGTYLVTVNIVGPFYESSRTLLVAKGATIGSGITVLADSIGYDPNTVGPPAYATDGSTLTVQGAGYSASFVATISLVSILDDANHPTL